MYEYYSAVRYYVRDNFCTRLKAVCSSNGGGNSSSRRRRHCYWNLYLLLVNENLYSPFGWNKV